MLFVGQRIDRLSIRGIHIETKLIEEEKGAFEIEVSALLDDLKSQLSYVFPDSQCTLTG